MVGEGQGWGTGEEEYGVFLSRGRGWGRRHRNREEDNDVQKKERTLPRLSYDSDHSASTPPVIETDTIPRTSGFGKLLVSMREVELIWTKSE